MVDDNPGEPSGSTINSSHPTLLEGNPTRHISKLPLELISYIIGLSLPLSSERIKVLYATRMVSKDWRNAIDSTPSLWNVVDSNLPLHINSTVIQRSGCCPLDVHFGARVSGSRRVEISGFPEFATIAMGEVGRWETANLKLPSPDDCLYFTSPAPLLRSLSVKYRNRRNPTTTIPLFGGIAPRLEVLNVTAVRMDWTASFIHGLRELDLSRMINEEISTEELLEILASTPRLEKLCVDYACLDHLPQPPQGSRTLIHLPNLKVIDLIEINEAAAGTILSSIQAPSCTLLRVELDWDEYNDSFPETALSYFKDFQRRAIHANHHSKIYFFHEGMEWQSQSGRLGGSGFRFSLPYGAVAVGVEWVARIIGTGTQELVHNLEILSNHETLTNDHFTAYHAISRCQSITKLTLEYHRSFPRPILDLLGSWQDSGDETRPLPGFPKLEVLVLRSSQASWLDDLEELVNRRFGGREDAIGDQVSSLAFILEVRAFGPVLGSRMDLARLQRLRATNGVRGITRHLDKHVPGMLAPVYDGEAGL